MHDAAPAAEYVLAAHVDAVSAAVPLVAALAVTREVPPAAYLPAAAFATVMDPSAAPTAEVMM